MKNGIRLAAFGNATSLLLAIAFTLCLSFDALFPGHAMYQAWQKLLPGFVYLTPQSFVIGLVESYGYGWFIALVWVPIYNLFAWKEPSRA